MAKTTVIDKLDEKISLLKLLSTCADACARGSEVIRFVHRKRLRPVEEEGAKGGSKIDVTYKIAGDNRSALTEADGSSQEVIMRCLRSVWGEDLNIVGEEEECGINKPIGATDGPDTKSDDLFDRYEIYPPSNRAVSSNLLSNINITSDEDGDANVTSSTAEELDTPVMLRDVTLYVDPMDGTREFVEGRVWNVQCLIGITYRGKPVGGVIGLPFFGSSAEDDGVAARRVGGEISVVCALNRGECTFVEQLNIGKDKARVAEGERDDFWSSLSKSSPGNNGSTKPSSTPKKKITLQVYTGDSKRVERQHCIDLLQTWTDASPVTTLDIQIMGGCGAKILRTAARGLPTADGNAISILLGTSSWDTAAPTSILFSCIQKFGSKGKCTDLFGGELVYDSSGMNVTNDLGSLVSCGATAVEYHERLCQAMRKDRAVLDSFLMNYWGSGGMEKRVDEILQNGGAVSPSRGKKTRFEEARQESQAIDIARSDEGYVMTCDELQTQLAEQLGHEHKHYLNLETDGKFELVGYAVPEKGAQRSEAGVYQSKFHLCWDRIHPLKRLKTDDGDKCAIYTPPEVVGYKRTAIDDSRFSVEFKLTT